MIFPQCNSSVFPIGLAIDFISTFFVSFCLLLLYFFFFCLRINKISTRGNHPLISLIIKYKLSVCEPAVMVWWLRDLGVRILFV